MRWSGLWQRLGTRLDLRRRRTWLFLAIAAVLVAGGRLIEAVGGLQQVELFADRTLADLALIAPLGIIDMFVTLVTTCEGACNATHFINPLTYLVTLWTIVSSVITESSWTGKILYVGAFALGAWLSFRLMRYAAGRDFGIVEIVVIIVLTPIAASLIGLVLQVAAMALFWLFGRAIGLILWVVSVFGALIAAIRLAREISARAETIEAVTTTVAAMTPQTGEPPAKP